MSIRLPIVSLLSTVFLASSLLAQPDMDTAPEDGMAGGPGCPRYQQHMKQFDEELQLTAEQKDKLQKLREEGKAARHEHAAKMKDVRQKMKDELALPKPDGKKLMDYASKTADLVEQMTKMRIDHLLKIKQILTPEQYQKFLSREWRGPDDCPKGGQMGKHKCGYKGEQMGGGKPCPMHESR